MTKLFEAIKRNPLPKVAMRYEGDGLRLLVALCRQLQRQAGGAPFFLACRTAGGLLGVEHVTAWRWLFALIHDGLLVEVEKGDAKRCRANHYSRIGSARADVLIHANVPPTVESVVTFLTINRRGRRTVPLGFQAEVKPDGDAKRRPED
jgi:hypothetical protein